MKFARICFRAVLLTTIIAISVLDEARLESDAVSRELRGLSHSARKHKKMILKGKKKHGNKYHRLVQAVKAIRRAKRRGQKLVVSHKKSRVSHRLVKAKRIKNRKLNYNSNNSEVFYNPNYADLFSPAGTPKFEVYPPINDHLNMDNMFQSQAQINLTDVIDKYRQNQAEIAKLKYLDDWREYERDRKKALYDEYQKSRTIMTDIQSAGNQAAASVGKASAWIPENLLGADFSGDSDYSNMGLGTIGLAYGLYSYYSRKNDFESLRLMIKDKYKMNGLQNASTEEENQSLEFINKKLNYAKKKIIRTNKAIIQRVNDIDNPIY